MAGELFLAQARVGVESGGYGVAATPTRRVYLAPSSGLVPGGSVVRHPVQTGDRAQVRSASPGPSAPGGSFSLPMDPDEILEWLHVAIDGDPAITTPGGGTNARLHTFTAPNALDSLTMQWHDGARPWQAAGVYANTLNLAFAVNGEATVSGDLFGASISQTALSGTVTDRNPEPTSGWETQLFIDAVDGTDNYGTTQIAAAQSVISGSVAVNNGLGRKYTAANTRDMLAAVPGVMEITGSLVFEASGAQALTEYNAFIAGTQRRLRLRFGDNDIIEAALTRYVDVDLQIVWTEMTLLGEDQGTRVYEGNFGFIYDSTNAFGIRIASQCARTAAFA